MKKLGFVPGIVVGAGLVFAYHHFVKPMPAAKKANG